MPLTHIDCFSGPGGICTGMHAAGFDTRVAIEYIKSCVDTYSKNHPEVHIIHSDIGDVTEEQAQMTLQRDLSILIKAGEIDNEPRDISWLKEQMKAYFQKNLMLQLWGNINV